jgi:2-dehydro-3-deoxyphosphogluconate aldolase/(4S)-4-hydroxy-2-oxoglutarate aldolase
VSVDEVIRASRIVPVVEIDDASAAVPLAEALVAAGLPIIEVTLRTPAGLRAVKEIVRHVPEMTVGAGTVLNAEQAGQATDAGASFLVSPGYTAALSKAAALHGIRLYPGTVTASEVLQAMEAGHRTLKFFPAETNGGIAALSALAGPLAHTGVQFMPTGGVNIDNLLDYLALPAVAAVGGTWIARRAQIAAGDFTAIGVLAAEAVARVAKTRAS